MFTTIDLPWQQKGEAVRFINGRLSGWAKNMTIDAFMEAHELRGQPLHLERAREGIFEIYRLHWADPDTQLDPTFEGFFIISGYKLPPTFLEAYARRRR